MFSKITKELELLRLEISSFHGALGDVADGLQMGPRGEMESERIATIEGQLEVLAGKIEAGIIRAEALKATARAAEDRARGHQQRGDKAYALAQSLEDSDDEDPFEQAARSYEDELSEGDGEAVGGVQPVYTGVEGVGSDLEAIRAAKRAR